ncbi:MAG TPA: hypothetical protein K8U90_07165 [Akkermansia muciniphila]|nr:hypothetical protein [Akkermansia muciniphila]
MNHKIDTIVITAGTIITGLFIINGSPVLGFLSALTMFACLPIDDK